MTKTQRATILKRLGGLVPDVDAICTAYDIDQKRAKKIQRGMQMLMQLFLDLLDLMSEQAEYIEGQEGTSNLIERQVDKEKDAKTILNNIEVFLTEDPDTIGLILKIVRSKHFADEFGKLEPARQVELFASLRTTINSLQRRDNILMEPESPGEQES